MNATTCAVDIAKNVFQLHRVDAHSGEIGRKKLSRAKFSEFFAQRLPARVVMEACGGAQHWARTLSLLGHRAELLPAHQVRVFEGATRTTRPMHAPSGWPHSMRIFVVCRSRACTSKRCWRCTACASTG